MCNAHRQMPSFDFDWSFLSFSFSLQFSHCFVFLSRLPLVRFIQFSSFALFLTFYIYLFQSFSRSFRTLCSLLLSKRSHTRQTHSHSCDGDEQLTLVLSLSSVAVFLDILASSFCPDRFLILLSLIFLFPVCE